MKIKNGKNKVNHYGLHYIGAIGDKLERNLTFKRRIVINNNHPIYESPDLIIFNDVDNNELVWRTTSSPDWLKDGFIGNIKFTIKGHVEYDNVKQTHIIRLKPVNIKKNAISKSLDEFIKEFD